jgi:hypothetical protein
LKLFPSCFYSFFHKMFLTHFLPSLSHIWSVSCLIQLLRYGQRHCSKAFKHRKVKHTENNGFDF